MTYNNSEIIVIYCLTVPGARNPSSRCQQGLSSEGCEGGCVLGLPPSFWWHGGSLWHPLACRHIMPISALTFTWCLPCVRIYLQISPFHQDTSHVGRGAHPTPGWASQVALVVKNLPPNAGDIRDIGSIPGLGRSPGGAHGNPLLYSCLENPMDREHWQATVYRIAQSWTKLK